MCEVEKLKLNPPCALRAKIYERQLCEVYKTLLQSPRLAPLQTRCGDAVCDRELLNRLARILDEYVIVGVAADLGRCRPTLYDNSHEPTLRDVDPTKPHEAEKPDLKKDSHETKQAYARYFERYINKVWRDPDREIGSGVDIFLRRHVMIEHAVKKSAAHFANNIITACERICADWATIGSLFFPGTLPTKVAKIATTGSDFHKGGQQVMIFTFLCADNMKRKLVYKPADVELDYRLVGNTHLASLDKTALGAGQSLTELINGFLSDEHKLPTYRVLPRHPGSGLQPQNGRLPIEKSYGYIEFLTHEPSGQPSDWVTNNEDDIRNFYRQWGGVLAMGSLFSLSDLHQENVIVHQLRPHLIDLEVSLTGPVDGVSGTLALDSTIGGLTGVDHAEVRRARGYDETANLIVAQLSVDPKAPRAPTMNRVRLLEHLAEPKDYIRHLVFGFALTMRTCREHVDDLTRWLDDTRVKKTVARFIPYPTGEFNSRIRLLYGPLYCGSPVPRAARDFKREPFIGWEQNALKPHQSPPTVPEGETRGQWPAPRQNYAIQTAEHNFADYLNCDVPSYYHRLNSRNLLNARGEKVVVRMDLSEDHRQTYFPQSTHRIVRKQVTDLSDQNMFQARVENAVHEIANGFKTDPKSLRTLALVTGLSDVFS
jgi:hypothetical protein